MLCLISDVNKPVLLGSVTLVQIDEVVLKKRMLISSTKV